MSNFGMTVERHENHDGVVAVQVLPEPEAKAFIEEVSDLSGVVSEETPSTKVMTYLASEAAMNPTVTGVEDAKNYAAAVVNLPDTVTPDYATLEEMRELRDEINSSFNEVASLLLDLQSRFNLLDERIERHNVRSSHKL